MIYQLQMSLALWIELGYQKHLVGDADYSTLSSKLHKILWAFQLRKGHFRECSIILKSNLVKNVSCRVIYLLKQIVSNILV